MAAPRQQARPIDGWLVFAAVMMFIAGFHNLIYGIATLSEYAVVMANLDVNGADTGLIYATRSFWGWLWIAVGVVELVVAYGILRGNELARWVGIGIAAINAIGQLAFLAAFPVWSVVIIAIDLAIIWALATYDTRVGARTSLGEPYPGDRPGGSRPGETSKAGTGTAHVGSGSTTRPGGAHDPTRPST